MKEMNKYRWLLIVLMMVMLLITLAMIWYFTNQNGQVSHVKSTEIAINIKNTLAKNFKINETDYFWRYNMEELVRKGAHFIEFMILGLIACTLFNLLFLRRVWLSANISLVLCFIYACLDEYRQCFVSERTPCWFDVKVDVSGAFIGIVMITIIFLNLWYIHKLKTRIVELEKQRR